MRYVGLDVHAATCTVAAIEQDGTVLFETHLGTSAENLVALAQAIAEPKTIVLEESTAAAWVWRTLRPYATQVVVADPVRNAWIGRDESNDDLSSARKLAELLRGGFVHPVHHTSEGQQVFKELVMAYHDTVREVARFKNKLKSKLHQHGLHCADATVYHPQHRNPWLEQLDNPGTRLQAQLLLERIDQIAQHRKLLRTEIACRARHLQPITRFRQLPGIGLIRAATFFSVIDTPHRFADKRKLCAYCGLGVVNRSSGFTEGPEHLNRRYNRHLKGVAKGAAMAAINLEDNRFASQYRRLVGKGISANNARLTVARAMVTILWTIWRTGEDYRPNLRED